MIPDPERNVPVSERLGRQSADDLAAMLNHVTHGDCLRVLRNLPDDCVDMVLTDPPYIAHYRNRSGQSVANDDNSRWVFPAFAELYRVLKPNRYCISFYGWNKVDRFFAAWREAGFQPVGHFTFVKRYASSAKFVRMMHEQAYLLAKGEPERPANPPDDVIYWQYTGNHLHPAQKPVTSLVPLIGAFSNPGEIILDPFAGSGTTGVAAKQCRRQFILIEKVLEHCQTARERLAGSAQAVVR